MEIFYKFILKMVGQIKLSKQQLVLFGWMSENSRNKSDTKLKVNQKSVFLSTKCNELLRLPSKFVCFLVCLFYVSFLAIIILIDERARGHSPIHVPICTLVHVAWFVLPGSRLIFYRIFIYGKIILIN